MESLRIKFFLPFCFLSIRSVFNTQKKYTKLHTVYFWTVSCIVKCIYYLFSEIFSRKKKNWKNRTEIKNSVFHRRICLTKKISFNFCFDRELSIIAKKLWFFHRKKTTLVVTILLWSFRVWVKVKGRNIKVEPVLQNLTLFCNIVPDSIAFSWSLCGSSCTIYCIEREHKGIYHCFA